jgi:predicted outer membrane repeat protein
MISDNDAGRLGGGIFNGGPLAAADTTISDNHAGSLGGGIYNGGPLAAADTTISRNTARGGGGIYQAADGDGSGVSLTSSAVLHNIPDNCEPPGTIMGCNS